MARSDMHCLWISWLGATSTEGDVAKSHTKGLFRIGWKRTSTDRVHGISILSTELDVSFAVGLIAISLPEARSIILFHPSVLIAAYRP